MTNRKVIVLGLATGLACVVSTAEARIVHDASAALRAAADAKANPYVDANGATWTVYSRAMPNDGTTNPITGQAVVTATPSAKGLGSYDGWCFVVGTAGTTDAPISGLGSGAVRAGDLVYHPQTGTRVALRFAPPRTGRYSMSAQFYTMNPGANGTIDATVLLNGATLLQESVPHNNSVGSSSSVCRFENVMLTTGDTLEFVVGPGFGDVYGHGCDSTALSLSIVEEGKDACTALERYDANKAVSAMLGGETPVNPYTEPSGAKWSLIGTPWASWRINETTPWDDFYRKDESMLMGTWPDGWNGCPAVTNANAWCRIGVNASGAETKAGVHYVGKDEIMIHPGEEASPMIRFTAPKRGTYLVTAVAHHVEYTGYTDKRDGVVLGLMVAGDQMAYGDFCCEAGGTPSGVVQALTPIVEAGETIDCMIHRGVYNICDSSTLGLTITRLEDAAWKGFDIGAAVTAQFTNQVTTGAFADANGGRWSTGYTTGLADEPTPFPQVGGLNDNKLYGLTYDGTDSWTYLLANMTGAPLPGWFNTDYYPERSYTRQREIVFHPGADKNPTLRFQLPPDARGYYNLTFHLRDIQPRDFDSSGVVMTVTTNGVEATHAWAGWWKTINVQDNEASIHLKDLYLKPTDRIDFRLDCNGNNGADLTALRGWIVPSGKKDEYKPGMAIYVR